MSKPAGKQIDAKRWFIRGRVQGVGYRNFAQRAAVDLSLTGYARNLDDGRVEIYAVGPVDKLSELAGMSAHAAAAELNVRRVATPSGAPWSARP